LRCHFCGDDLAFAGRPEKPPEGFVPGTKEYQFEKLYRAVAIFWIIDGCLAILVSLEILPPWASAISNMLVSYLGVALSTGFLIAVLGVGMLMKLPLARKLVSGFCWFRVIAGLFGLGIILRSGDFNLAKHNIYVLAILNVVDTLFAAFQIWLLSVTDYDVLN
jgi:hypothetical protein